MQILLVSFCSHRSADAFTEYRCLEPPESDDSSLLVASDDSATLEAALNFLDFCADDPLTNSDVPDQTRDLVDTSEFLDNVNIPLLPSDTSANEPIDTVNAVSVSTQVKRHRITPKQEIAQLRAQERELACRLELLRLQAFDQKQCGGSGKYGNVLLFWKKIASRQHQSRLNSERENRRLRSLVAMHIGRAKRLKFAWKKHMATEGYQEENPAREQVVKNFSSSDTPDVLEELDSASFSNLEKEADGVYADLDAFKAGVRPQRINQVPFLEHSDTYTLPFDRFTVGTAMWHALAMRFRADEHHVDSSENTIRCCVLRSIQIANTIFSLRIRWVGREYYEDSRTVIITQTLLEPQYLPISARVDFRETQVSIVTTNESSPQRHADSVSSTISTYTNVTGNCPEGGSGDGIRSWIASTEGASVRDMWMHVFEVRKNANEDQVFEETRVCDV
ncbi:hypothetical protein PF005_g23308 [Phytophthora fragariae]|uniref:Uncharacterized protein n=1 Tax=Phytophthora fragariae TaxID=53985 RepID=A0A6A3W7R8_9STRA|nr:hypothetical protein PF005_g23308 [Phytophthora fragariae]